MKRPRIIIADTDEKYISSLQYKFATEFFDAVDIEIITDEGFFNDLFSQPQKADILVVSDNLYDMSIQRHNISNIFVLMESEEEEKTGDLNIVRLMKYTSTGEILNEVIRRSQGTIQFDIDNKQETQVVVVTSATGGAGKTTIALGIAACLSKNLKKTLYINAGRLQAFNYMFDNQTSVTSKELYTQLADSDANIYDVIKHFIRTEGFAYVPQFKTSLMSLGIDYSIFEKLIRTAKKSGDYEYIIVDAESTFDEYLTGMFDIADKVIIVVNQSEKSVHYTNRFVSNINGVNGEKYVFICNNFKKEEMNCLIRPDLELKFNVNEYVGEFENYYSKRIMDYAGETGIKKSTFLIV